MMAESNKDSFSEEKRVEIYRTVAGEVVFDVDRDGETIWATQAQIAELFGIDRTVVGRHLRNIFRDGELVEDSVCAKNAHVASDGKTYRVKMYNLDAIISVGYRVNSKKATDFRIWATRTLKEYVVNGVAVNEQRLKELPEKRLKDVEGMMGVVQRLIQRNMLDAGEANGVLEVITRYTRSFEALKEYDDGHIVLSRGRKARKKLTVEASLNFIEDLRDSLGAGKLFGKMRDESFYGVIEMIDQSFDGDDLYGTVAEKAANLLYLIIKDHPFYDGNKRIGALLFIIYLTINDFHLTKNGETKISDRALTAVALLIAESEPAEKGLIVALVCKLLEG
ncbi:virulence protein RhuM/Fic/DOC family protein [Candidatus Saccharibacteria bacterium]|nr:virulence protein RhuM/Fic/DOC family protein [Candidatus Saccharibacteria bacterium]